MTKFFWEYPVTCNAACHAKAGVGPATDYATPLGTDVHAPFAGEARPYWTDEGGWGIEINGTKEIFRGQHLASRPQPGKVAWRQHVAETGNTGSATTGPHIHAYIIIKATGERISFQKWYEDIVLPGLPASSKPKPKPLPPKPAPAPARQRYIDLGSSKWYWYDSWQDAVNMRDVHGKRPGERMLTGRYPVLATRNGAVQVLSNSMGKVWLHPSVTKSHRIRG
jgi:hypothetical protein